MSVFVSLVFVVLRALLALRWFYDGSDLLACWFGVVEFSALVFTVWGLFAGKVDRSRGALLVPLCYMVPLLIRFTGPQWGPNCLHDFAGVVMFLEWLVLLWLGVRCTVGVPVFSSLAARGPYAFIRHPLSCLQVLVVIVFAVRFPCWWNLYVVGLKIVSAAYCVMREEQFLLTQPVYVDYVHRVRWRWLPGVW